MSNHTSDDNLKYRLDNVDNIEFKIQHTPIISSNQYFLMKRSWGDVVIKQNQDCLKISSLNSNLLKNTYFYKPMCVNKAGANILTAPLSWHQGSSRVQDFDAKHLSYDKSYF